MDIHYQAHKVGVLPSSSLIILFFYLLYFYDFLKSQEEADPFTKIRRKRPEVSVPATRHFLFRGSVNQARYIFIQNSISSYTLYVCGRSPMPHGKKGERLGPGAYVLSPEDLPI